jgi:GPI mannosyltransferase 3
MLLSQKRDKLLFGIGLLIYLLTAWFSEGYYHPDEHFQVIEFGQYLLGKNDATNLAWEYKAQIRPALQPMMAAGIIGGFRMVGINDPFFIAFMLRAITALASLGVYLLISRMVAAAIPQADSKWFFLALCMFLWFMPFISVRFSSEQWSAMTFLLGVYLITQQAQGKKGWMLLLGVGLLWGFSFFLRFQIAFALLGVGVWLIWIQKRKITDFAALIAGGLLSTGFCIYLDYLLYGSWVFTPYNYYKVNVVDDKASTFGTEPWWGYFSALFFDLILPLSIVLLLLAIQGIRNQIKHVFVWAFIPFLLGHMLISHKEIRFLFPMAIPFLFFITAGWIHWKAKLGGNLLFKGTMAVLVAFNLFFLACRSYIPANPLMPYYHLFYEAGLKQPVKVISYKTSVYGIKNIFRKNANDYTFHFYKSNQTLGTFVRSIASLDSNVVFQRPNERFLLVLPARQVINLKKYEAKHLFSYTPWWTPSIRTPEQWSARKSSWHVYELTRK